MYLWLPHIKQSILLLLSLFLLLLLRIWVRYLNWIVGIARKISWVIGMLRMNGVLKKKPCDNSFRRLQFEVFIFIVIFWIFELWFWCGVLVTLDMLRNVTRDWWNKVHRCTCFLMLHKNVWNLANFLLVGISFSLLILPLVDWTPPPPPSSPQSRSRGVFWSFNFSYAKIVLKKA